MFTTRKNQQRVRICMKYVYIIYLLTVALSFFQIPYAYADQSEPSFYYIVTDRSNQYYIIQSNQGISGDEFLTATSANAIYNGYGSAIMQEHEEMCSWQVITVEPNVYELPFEAEPPEATPSDATPSDATPSDATPSDATPSDATPSNTDPVITEYPVYLKTSERYIVSELLPYANQNQQIALKPVFHDKNVHMQSVEVVSETQRNITYKFVFDHQVTLKGRMNGTEVINHAGEQEVIVTIAKPNYNQQNEINVDAYYECNQCGNNISLSESCLLEVPRRPYESNNSDQENEPSPPAEPIPPAGGTSTGGGVGSGGTGGGSGQQNGEEGLFAISYSSPEKNGWYYSLPRVDVKASEEYIIYYRLWNTSQGQKKEQAEIMPYGSPFLFSEDGIYQCEMWAQKEDSNTRYHEEILTFKIDRKEPQISVNYDSGTAGTDNHYPTARRANIVIEEANFSEKDVEIKQFNGVVAGSWSHDKNRHTLAVLFNEDGSCSLDVSCTDLAGRKGQTSEKQTFTIDTKMPELKITGVEHLTANKDAVVPVVTYSDENIDNERTKITLISYEKGEIVGKRKRVWEGKAVICTFEPIEEDDNYTLKAQIYDKAGNLTEQAVSFSINQKGATFVFNNREILGGYTNQVFTPAIEVWNVDEMMIVSLTLNGQDVDYTYEDNVVVFKDPIKTDGKYVIGLEVKDTAGNLSIMKPVEFFFDQTIPVNIIQGVEHNAVYHNPVTINIQTEQKNDIITEVRLNGELVDDYKVDEQGRITLKVSRTGEYKLEVISVDAAGNISDTSPISFKYEIGSDSQRSAGNVVEMSTGWWQKTIVIIIVVGVIIARFVRVRTRKR